MGCPPKVQAALENVSGVGNVKVENFDKASKSADVTLTCNAETKPKELLSALEADGYGGSVK